MGGTGAAHLGQMLDTWNETYALKQNRIDEAQAQISAHQESGWTEMESEEKANLAKYTSEAATILTTINEIKTRIDAL